MDAEPHRIRQAFARGGRLAVAVLASYVLATEGLARVHSLSPADDLVAGMWSVIATVFVFHVSREESRRAAATRLAATGISFALTELYLLVFPFRAWGLAALVGAGAIATSLLRRPQDTVTTGIATTVIMVAAARSPDDAWKQPVLRALDTLIGIAVGLLASRFEAPKNSTAGQPAKGS